MPASACRAQSNLFVATLYIRGYGVWDSCGVAGCRAPPQQNSAPPEGPLWLQCVESAQQGTRSHVLHAIIAQPKKFWRCVIQMSRHFFRQFLSQGVILCACLPTLQIRQSNLFSIFGMWANLSKSMIGYKKLPLFLSLLVPFVRPISPRNKATITNPRAVDQSPPSDSAVRRRLPEKLQHVAAPGIPSTDLSASFESFPFLKWCFDHSWCTKCGSFQIHPLRWLGCEWI